MQQLPCLVDNEDFLRKEYTELRKSQSQIAVENGMSLSSVEYYIKKHGLIRSRTRIKNLPIEANFDLRNPMFCYYIGLIAADGYCDLKNNRISLRLNTEDDHVLKELAKEYFGTTSVIKYYRTQADLTISSTRLMGILRDLGIAVENKTFNLKFPVLPSQDSYKYFIRGYLDGDGNIRKMGFRATTGSEDFIRGLINYLNPIFRTNINLTYQKGRLRSYPKIEVGGWSAVSILEWIYTHNQHIAIRRKLDKVKWIADR